MLPPLDRLETLSRRWKLCQNANDTWISQEEGPGMLLRLRTPFGSGMQLFANAAVSAGSKESIFVLAASDELLQPRKTQKPKRKRHIRSLLQLSVL